MTHAPGTHLLTSRDVARLLGVTCSTIQRWAKCGKIRCVRLSSRCVRFEPTVVETLIAVRMSQEVPRDK